MHAALSFSLSPDPDIEAQALERILELIELIDLDKEEQALDPDGFTGNAPDYPEWLKRSFQDRALSEEILDFCDLEAEDLAGWCFESWYEDLIQCLSFHFRLEDGGAPGRHTLIFEVAEEHYGGDLSHAWFLLAAGATALEASGAIEDDAGGAQGLPGRFS